MSRTRVLPLTWLAARRGLPPAAALLGAVYLAALALVDWAPELARMAAEDPARLAGALSRQGVWAGAALLLLPLLVVHFAGTVHRWRRGEVDWLASSPARPLSILVATWSGALLAGTAALAAAALAAEATAGADRGGVRLAGVVETPRVTLAPGDSRASPLVRPPGPLPEGSVLAAELTAVAISEAVRVSLRASRPGAEGAGELVEAWLKRRTRLEVPAPTGPGEVQLDLELSGPVPHCALTRLELLTPTASERAAGAALFGRAWIALAAWLALALGLGAWTSPATAGLAIAGSWLIAALRPEPIAWLPGADLARALGVVGDGVVPARIGWEPWLGAAVLALVGLGLARWNLHSWRRAE